MLLVRLGCTMDQANRASCRLIKHTGAPMACRGHNHHLRQFLSDTHTLLRVIHRLTHTRGIHPVLRVHPVQQCAVQ